MDIYLGPADWWRTADKVALYVLRRDDEGKPANWLCEVRGRNLYMAKETAPEAKVELNKLMDELG